MDALLSPAACGEERFPAASVSLVLPAALAAAFGATSEGAGAAVATTADLVGVILAAVPAAELGRLACASVTFRDCAAPRLRALAAGTWHPAYLTRWWSRAAAEAA